jgi:P-type E1-E2 ATPase
VAGLSRAAKHGILIKGGKALEMMARVRTLVIDKTGTLTDGRARVVSVHSAAEPSTDEIIRTAASLDQASKHIIAQAIVAEARRRHLELTIPTDVTETPGEGLAGLLNGRRAIVGGVHFVASRVSKESASISQAGLPGAVLVAVGIDGRLAGQIVLADELRAGTSDLLAQLRGLGIQRVVLATGDRAEVAKAITLGLSFDAVRSELSPDQKVMVVLSERKSGPVMMIGDGVNDAPALAAADIGVAMGARGAAASAEAADVVLLVDHLDRIVPAIQIASQSRFIALESVYVGIGLSAVGMIAAALGFLSPVQGAIAQELIDVAVVANALRALKD